MTRIVHEIIPRFLPSFPSKFGESDHDTHTQGLLVTQVCKKSEKLAEGREHQKIAAVSLHCSKLLLEFLPRSRQGYVISHAHALSLSFSPPRTSSFGVRTPAFAANFGVVACLQELAGQKKWCGGVTRVSGAFHFETRGVSSGKCVPCGERRRLRPGGLRMGSEVL